MRVLALSALFAVLLAGTGRAAPSSGTPAPAASPAAAALKEIGRVRARSPLCSQMVGHADAAISYALENDARIALTISNLRTIDLDANAVKKANGTRALLAAYQAMRATAVAGKGQVDLLRSDAKAATDPTAKADLDQFANALAGALERQRKMSEELARYISYVDSHASIDPDAQQQILFDIQWAQTLPYSPFYGNPQDWVPPSLSDVAKSAAQEFDLEESAVNADEGTAAGRIEPAFSGCL